jgi:osmotically-inducible protein OsmY
MVPTETRMRSHADLEEGRLADAAHLEDTRIAAAIADALSRNGLVPPKTVWATVVGGHVTLNGQVEGWRQRDAIERAVQSLRGIRGLTNLLAVSAEVISREVQGAIVEARASPW